MRDSPSDRVNRVLDILADREWHDARDVIDAVGPSIPPGPAARRIYAERMDRVDPESRPDFDTWLNGYGVQRAVHYGRIDMMTTTLKGLIRHGGIEAKELTAKRSFTIRGSLLVRRVDKPRTRYSATEICRWFGWDYRAFEFHNKRDLELPAHVASSTGRGRRYHIEPADVPAWTAFFAAHAGRRLPNTGTRWLPYDEHREGLWDCEKRQWVWARENNVTRLVLRPREGKRDG